MPNSLKCKIKHLCHNRTITESERDRILKALEQEPKEGHWYNPLSESGYFCTNCESNSDFMYPYCPHCGAKMGGAE